MFEVKVLRSPDDLSEAFWIRDEVFTKEQGFSAPDTDALDETALHVVCYDGDKPAATGRAYCEENGTTWHFGRIAVLASYRGKKLGKFVMDELEKCVRPLDAKRVTLSAQLYAVPFYEKCGFVTTGERTMDEFCEHEHLIKDL